MSSVSNLQPVPTGTRVLVVDDHPDTVMFLSRLLQKAGCTVTTAVGQRDAEAFMGAQKFDLLISDLGLADGSGFDLMRAARRSHAIKGIALSGFDSADERKRTQEAGFSEHLVKPIDVGKLLHAMHRTLNG